MFIVTFKNPASGSRNQNELLVITCGKLKMVFGYSDTERMIVAQQFLIDAGWGIL